MTLLKYVCLSFSTYKTSTPLFYISIKAHKMNRIKALQMNTDLYLLNSVHFKFWKEFSEIMFSGIFL